MASGTLSKDVILNLEINDKEIVNNISALTKKLDELKIKRQSLSATIKKAVKDEQEANGKVYTQQQEQARYDELYYEALAKLDVEIKETKRSIGAYQKELQNNLVAEKAAEGSLDAMRAKLLNMRKEYEALSEAERNDPLSGGKKLKNIQDLTAEIKQLEQAQGDYRRSVGNYASAFDASTESISKFGQILGGIFGSNGVIGKAATVVVGFGRNLKQMSKDTSDMANTIVDSATKAQSSTDVLETTAKTITNVGDAATNTTKTVQGFGKALYETDAVEEKTVDATNNVAKATGGISGAFKTAGTAVKSFGKQLLTLLANPFVAAFTAIVLVLMKLVDQFKKNDDAMTSLQRVFAAFKPILDVINKGFQFLVEIIGKVADGFANVVGAIMSVIPGLDKYAESERDVVDATDALEESERQYTVKHAKREKEISELNAKAADSEKYSFSERKKFMEEAAKLEKEDLQENKANAQEKLRVRQKEMALNMGFAEFTEEVYEKMSDEMKDELAGLEAMVHNAEKAYNDGMRTINKRMSTFTKQEESEQKQRANAAKEAAKERLKNEKEALNALEDMWYNSIANMEDKEYALTKANFQRQINTLNDRLKTEKNLTKTAKEAINKQIILLEADMQIKLGEIRRKYREDLYKKELDDAKNYYSNLLRGMKTPEAKLQIQLELNKIDTDILLKELKKPLEAAKKVVDDTKKDLALSENEIFDKYKNVFDERDIDTTKGGFEALKQLIQIYENDVLVEQVKFENNKNAITKASIEEENRLRNQSVKDLKDIEDKKFDIQKKHQEILNSIDRENDLELFRNNEVKKAEIMKEYAEQRLQTAQNEYRRLKDERQKYTDEELTYIYGSVDAYDEKLAESALKVTQANKEVKQSIIDVTNAQKAEKVKMLNTVTDIIGAIDKMAGAFQSLFEVMAEDNAKYSEFATAMAMVQILTSAAIATAQAVMAAVQAGGFTGPAAPITIPLFIVEMVAIVASSIASAVSLLSKAKQSKQSTPKFAEGGLVGNKTTNKKDDKVDAKLSEGEYVIKSEVVSKLGVPFFDFLNYGRKVTHSSKSAYAEGGVVVSNPQIPQSVIQQTESQFNMEDFKNVMVDALSEMPNPEVSVKEITNVQKRVKAKERLSKAK